MNEREMTPVQLSVPPTLTFLGFAGEASWSPELPPRLRARDGLQGLELLQLALAQAPSPFDFEGVRNAKRPPVTAQRLGAPVRGELLEALVVEACDLGRRGQGGHWQRR